MKGPFWFCVASFLLLYVLLLRLRKHLEDQRASVEQLYLALDD
jgi:hypothetical protein